MCQLKLLCLTGCHVPVYIHHCRKQSKQLYDDMTKDAGAMAMNIEMLKEMSPPDQDKDKDKDKDKSKKKKAAASSSASTAKKATAKKK